MKKKLLTHRKLYSFTTITLFLGSLAFLNFAGLLINITPSMKLGLYIKASGNIKPGDIVAFCLAEPYKILGLTKTYIQQGSKCGGTDPLIKQVIAIPGDNVVLADNYIEVNSYKQFYPTLHQDSAGRSLAAYPRGTYSNTQGYWMIGTHAKNSWDSRYFGPIENAQILYKLKPLLTW
jgi:conjugative transfer signal peptidase TraF